MDVTTTKVLPRRRRVHLLLVDDHEQLVLVLARILVGAGFQVTMAISGEEALACAARRQRPFDFALLDVEMPGLDGRDTAIRLRELCPTLPFAFLTAHSQRYTAEELLRTGAQAVLLKPIAPADLIRVVQESLADGPETRPFSGEEDPSSCPPSNS